MNLSLKQLKGLLDQYDQCELECDGMTRVLHTVLAKKKVQHKVYQGEVEYNHKWKYAEIPWHMWIVTANGFTIDYRAKMWLRNLPKVPHGVFEAKKFPNITYNGKVDNEPVLSTFLFQMLTGGFSIPTESLLTSDLTVPQIIEGITYPAYPLLLE